MQYMIVGIYTHRKFGFTANGLRDLTDCERSIKEHILYGGEYIEYYMVLRSDGLVYYYNKKGEHVPQKA